MSKDIEIEYPSLFTSADTYSKKAQDRFLSLNKLTLLLLFVATILASIYHQNWAVWASSFLLILSTSLSTIMLFFKFEKGWYEGRAIAESIKTLCWKYMTGAKPFDQQMKIGNGRIDLLELSSYHSC